MTDPRDRVETFRIRCCAVGEEWEIGGVGRPAPSRSGWPEVVELAQKILAADEAWKDSQTPTLEGLRAKYPGRSIGMARVVCGPTYCWRARVGPCESPHIVTEIAALRWLAAKLEEVTPVETEQQFRECPACDGRGGIARQVSEDEWYHSPCEVCEGRRKVPVEELA